MTNDKISAFFLPHHKLLDYKSNNHKVLNLFVCIYKKRYFCKRYSFLPHPSTPTKYFTVSAGQEVDFAPVIAMNFMCYTFFLYFSGFSRGGPDPPRSTTGSPCVDRSN